MNARKLEQYATDPMAFLDDLIIPGARGAVRFGDVMVPAQRERFEALGPSLLAVARGKHPPIGRFWFEATKGFSKSSDLAEVLLWLLAFTPRPLYCQLAAADQDQADEPRKSARGTLHLNPWLDGRVKIHNWRLVCSDTGANADVLAADIAGSHGSRPDVLFLDELVHVTKLGYAQNLLDNSSKVPHGLVVVSTNAGQIPSWQYDWRELARTSDRWSFHQWAQPSPWLDPAEIEEAKRRNPLSRYLRLFEGVWSRGGDALDAKSIEDAITLDGPELAPNPEFGYVAGLDLSTKRDHSALVVLGGDWKRQRVRLSHCESWAPSVDGHVDLQAVQTATEHAARRFDAVVYFDPHQAGLMVQQLRSRGIPCVEMPFTGQNNSRMASTLLQTFRERRIDLYRHDELLADLSKLSIVERSFGIKLEAPADESGHADRAFALAACLPAALEAMGGPRTIVLDSPFIDGGILSHHNSGPEPSWF